MASQIVFDINFAHVDAATLNLKKRELRITFTAFLTPDILKLREDIQRLAATEEPIRLSIETIQPELPLE